MGQTAHGEIHYPFEGVPAEGEVIEVAAGILWLRLPLPMKLDHVNCYALDGGDGWTIVDTGFDTKRTRAIWKQLLDGPLAGKPVARVLVTHHHPDHIGLAGWFQTEYGAELITTRTAWLMGRMLQLDEQPSPVRETLDFWASAGMDAEVFEQRRHERSFNFADVVAPMPLGFTRIAEDSQIAIGGRNWMVRIGNGHAPEHATLWSDDGAVVLAGDQIIASISSNLGVYATEPEADPVAEWLEACERLSGFGTDDHLILPGHKLPFRGMPKRMRQLIDNHQGALDRLRGHLAKPHSAGESFLPIFKRNITGAEYGLALVESLAHCLHLWHLGEASRERREDGAWVFQMR